MALVRFNPMRELLNVEREFNKIFNAFENRFGFPERKAELEEWESAEWTPLTDIYEDNNNYVLKMDLPGISRNEVKMTYANGYLSISGERKQEKVTESGHQHRIERTYGKFFRTFNLPREIKSDKIDAEFKDGQLTVTIPKSEEAKPKELEIKIK